VRLARPGEFSERAFLNDKLDLAQAEAIADLIDASSEQAARSAMRSLQGEFSNKVNGLVESLINLRIYIEAALDFPEEEIDFLTEGKVGEQTETLLQQISELQLEAKQGALLREGMTIVIAGRPNAGKSSLLNALAGRESAIVTDIAGTTRDILKEHIAINGVPLHIIDTAGLRETSDIVEQEGVRRALKAIESADRILLVVDIQQKDHLAELQQEFLKNLPRQIPVSIIFNKIDLAREQPHFEADSATIYLSAKHGQGLEILRNHLLDCVGFNQTLEGGFIARRRHLDAIERAKAHIEHGLNQLVTTRAGELLAEDLRQAQDALSEITGQFTADDLLGRIFSSFCIGK
jgi:tRNA modification GTPase